MDTHSPAILRLSLEGVRPLPGCEHRAGPLWPAHVKNEQADIEASGASAPEMKLNLIRSWVEARGLHSWYG